MSMNGWENSIAELRDRRALATAMGGPERLARQHANGRLDARQRLAALCDHGSFAELWPLAGLEENPAPVAADALPCGHGLINGCPAAVGAEDFSSKGGSIGAPGATKRERLARLALDERMPFVMVLDGAGARAAKSLERYIPHPHDLGAISDLSGLVPTISVVAGASAGHGALTAALSDFVIMVRGAGALFTAGPTLVLGSTGARVEPQGLGGADVHAVRSGVVHIAVDTDEQALSTARRLLSYLPSNAWERVLRTPVIEGDTSTARRETRSIVDLVPADPRQAYDIRPVIDEIVDAGSALELHRDHGESIITAFARIGGHSVAIVANQPKVLAGSVTVTAANKAARFVEIASSFHLPLLYLADNPGVMAGYESEAAGILRASARMFAAQHRSASVKVHISMRKVFGFGSSIMALNQFDGRSFMFALPGVTLGVMPAKGSATISNASADTAAALTRSEGSGPWKLASEAAYDNVIHPYEMRDTVLRVLDLSERSTRMVEPTARTGYLP